MNQLPLQQGTRQATPMLPSARCTTHLTSVLTPHIGRRAVLLTTLITPQIIGSNAKADETMLSKLSGGVGQETGMLFEALQRESRARRLDSGLAWQMADALPAVLDEKAIITRAAFKDRLMALYRQEWGPYSTMLPPGSLPMVASPDLLPQSSISNPSIFNFTIYLSYKILCMETKDSPLVRTQVQDAVGERLALGLLGAERLRSLSGAAAGPQRWDAARSAIEDVLGALQAGKYILGSSAAYGAEPSIGNPQLGAGGRPRTVVDIDKGGVEEGVALVPGSALQIRLLAPADLEASVALRAEEDGFAQELSAYTIAAVLRAGGYEASRIEDEYFFQDYYQPPKKLSDRILLAVGDPFFMVEVPWTPTSTIIDFNL